MKTKAVLIVIVMLVLASLACSRYQKTVQVEVESVSPQEDNSASILFKYDKADTLVSVRTDGKEVNPGDLITLTCTFRQAAGKDPVELGKPCKLISVVRPPAPQ